MNNKNKTVLYIIIFILGLFMFINPMIVYSNFWQYINLLGQYGIAFSLGMFITTLLINRNNVLVESIFLFFSSLVYLISYGVCYVWII